ncbi:MAG: HNH endonuclease [Sedimentisphaerales bacterium]|nr:HNH endonuclease [Sedimentisphaerales bacterium]
MNALEQTTTNASVAVRPKTFTELREGQRHSPVVTRDSACERGYNYRWRKARIAYLIKNPLCVECASEGRTEQAVVVDHIIPHKGNRELFWNKNNWQGLCKRHHDIKTAKQDGGFGRV